MRAERPDLAPLIDHALLDPHQGTAAILQCCSEARHFGFAGVCVASRWVATARDQLPREGKGPTPQLIAVVGFPFGAVPAGVKQAEAEAAAAAGADELDVVPDFGSLADRNSTPIHDELAAICELGLPVKVILEGTRGHQGLRWHRQPRAGHGPSGGRCHPVGHQPRRGPGPGAAGLIQPCRNRALKVWP